MSSKNMQCAMNQASEARDMMARGDYNYARLSQIMDTIDGLVGQFADDKLVWPQAVYDVYSCNRRGPIAPKGKTK